MKNLLFILLILFSVSVSAQTMQATKIETTIDFKFKVLQNYITEANKEIKSMVANEAIVGDVKNRELIKQLALDLQNVMKLNRPKFIEVKETIIQVDSIATIKQKESILTEIDRLKSEINLGNDSTLIQPKINELLNQRNDLNKIINNWVRVQ